MINSLDSNGKVNPLEPEKEVKVEVAAMGLDDRSLHGSGGATSPLGSPLV